MYAKVKTSPALHLTILDFLLEQKRTPPPSIFPLTVGELPPPTNAAP